MSAAGGRERGRPRPYLEEAALLEDVADELVQVHQALVVADVVGENWQHHGMLLRERETGRERDTGRERETHREREREREGERETDRERERERERESERAVKRE